ncbi:MAG: hypothetical protein Q4G28_12185, partial [Neisseria sp.]|nr:hypothetical protein [Neisseria sp.]
NNYHAKKYSGPILHTANITAAKTIKTAKKNGSAASYESRQGKNPKNHRFSSAFCAVGGKF